VLIGDPEAVVAPPALIRFGVRRWCCKSGRTIAAPFVSSRGFVIEGRLVRHYRRRQTRELWDSVIMSLVLDHTSPGSPYGDGVEPGSE
jgi:hypothetical protein